MRARLTMKLSGVGRLLVEHVDLDAAPSEAEFRDAAKSVAERLGKKVADRPASKTRKREAIRVPVTDEEGNNEDGSG